MTVTCKKCGKKFKTYRYLDQHKRRKIPCDRVLKCDKCDKVFDSSSHLQQHLNRKTPCVPEEIPVILESNPENRCQFCNKTYSTKSSLKRHHKTCDKDTNLEVMVKLLVEQNKQLIKDNAEIKQQVAVPGSNQTIINNQLNIINVMNFPLQDFSQIDMKRVLQIVSSQPTNMIIPEIIEHLHGNPDYPDRQNVFMTETGAKVTIVFGGEKEKTWHPVPRDLAFGQLKSEAMGILTKNKRPNFKLIEAAQETQHRDTSYQEKINDLASCDTTEDDVLAQKLVGFGESFHKGREIKSI